MVLRSAARLAASTVAMVAVVGVLVTAARLHSLQQRLAEPVLQEVALGEPSWAGRLEEWVLDPRLFEIAGSPSDGGNAAELLWPNGLTQTPARCPAFWGLGPEHVAWSSNVEQLQAAAACPSLVVFHRAASRSNLDVLAVRGGLEGIDLIAANRLHIGVRSGLQAMVARAYLEADQGRLETADSALRAALRLSLLLIQQDGTLEGMEIGHRALPVVLEHLEAIRGRQGRVEEADSIARMIAAVPPFETCTGLLNAGLARTGQVDLALPFVQAVARDGRLPLAMRVRAAVIVAEGYRATPKGLLLGQSAERRSLLQEIATDPTMSGWVDAIQALEPDGALTRLRVSIELAIVGRPRN